MYQILSTKKFDKRFVQITKKNKQIKKKILVALEKIRQNPYNPSLRSHKVNARSLGVKWSSFVTKDIRIIWDFDKNNDMILIMLTLGSHSGKHKVYN